MRVSFDCGRLNERGVAVSMFEYAFHARALLGVEPVVLHDAHVPPLREHVERFEREFPTYSYTSEDKMQRLIERERIEVAYFQKTGRHDVHISKSCRTAVHEVFKFFTPQGDAYAYISRWLAKAMTGGRYPFVPYIVDMPAPNANLRAGLGLPPDAFVIGRHGAISTFNTPFVPAAIEAALGRRKNLWFLLLNTGRFSEHERIIHLPATADRQWIANFVACCDAGLNARRVGETFGLAIAEFLVQDKPVLVWEGGRDRNHLELVSDPRFIYRTQRDLTRLLLELEPRDWNGAWRSRVDEFSPAAVMQTFAAAFLEAPAQTWPKRPLGHGLGVRVQQRLGRLRDRYWIMR